MWNAWLDNNAGHVECMVRQQCWPCGCMLGQHVNTSDARAHNMPRLHTRPHCYKLHPSTVNSLLRSCDTVREMPNILQLHGSAYEEARENKIREIRQKVVELGLNGARELFLVAKAESTHKSNSNRVPKPPIPPEHRRKSNRLLGTFFNLLAWYLGENIICSLLIVAPIVCRQEGVLR